MSQIRSANTRPEVLVRKHLHHQGFRFRLNTKTLPGKPDIVLNKYRTVIFVHGCFWHGHTECKYFRLPKTNTKFWTEKIEGNIRRDNIKQDELTTAGWRVIILWECELKNVQKAETAYKKLIESLKKLPITTA
jgi:DNA mismatch endonuclease (patch repair protein)